MSKAIGIGLVGLAVSASMLGIGFLAGKSGSAVAAPERTEISRSFDGIDRTEIETIVREYLIANPEVLRDAQAALDARERENRRIAQQRTIESASDELFNAAYDGLVGNPDGDITIVEFFDYNCGFCKRGVEDMDRVIAADPNVRFVLKEFPILGPDSRAAHVVSMAFRTLMPESYGEFHRSLMLAPGGASEASAIRVALQLGADEADLRREMQNPEIEDAFERTYTLANRLSVTGTPSYVVGDHVVFGAQGSDVLLESVEAARAGES